MAASVDSLRVPPHSIGSERSLLGGVMQVPDAFWLIADQINDDDFYQHDHRLIFAAIQREARANRPFDAITIAELVSGEVAEDYVYEITGNAMGAGNIRAYAERVRDRATLRRLIDAGTRIASAGFQPDGRDAAGVLADAQQMLGAILQNQPCELEAPQASLRRIMERGLRRAELKGQPDGLLTGIDDLDALLRGMKPGQLIVVAGRPKMGKTTLAMNIAEHVAIQQKKRVAIHSLEMQPDELIERAVCSIGKIPHEAVQAWDLTDEQWNLFGVATAKLSGAPIVTSKPRNVRVEHLVAQTRRTHMEQPLALVVIDYLQLIDATGAENRNLGVSEITRQLKLMAGDLGVPVILLSQLNRDLERRPNKRPIPADLRDSGSIEQDADCVIFVYRDEVYDENSRDRGTAEIIVSLQRGGRTGMVRVASRLDMCRFDNLEHGWQPARPPESDQAPKKSSGWGARKTRVEATAPGPFD